MLSQEKLAKFAELAVKIGVNMQKGQEVVVRADVKCADFAHIIAKKAYEYGAKRVHLQWRDEVMSRMDMDYAQTSALCDVPSFAKEFNEYCIARRVCLISVASSDPNALAGCDPKKVAEVNVALRKANQKFSQATMSDFLRWTVVSVPTEAWAKTVFPNDEPSVAVDKLWEAIAKTMRLDEDDPTAAWRRHIDKLNSRARFLNQQNFEYLHYVSANGTDLKVGLAHDHVWCAAEEAAQDGVTFTANMPTEEVFTAPHRNKVDGVVKNALPLVYQGQVIDGFTLKFKEGKVVDFAAEKGYDALKGLLDTDEGARHIGEAALIGKHSPIAESGILFFNTLFDENASCHLALGAAYPTTVKNGNDLSADELLAKGANDSVEHVDFMIGTKDMHIDGIKYDGTVVNIFTDGEWTV